MKEEIKCEVQSNKLGNDFASFYRGASRKRCCICMPVSTAASIMLVFFALQLLFSGCKSLMTTGLRKS